MVEDQPTIYLCDQEDGKVLEKGLVFGPGDSKDHYLGNDGKWKPVRRKPDSTFHNPNLMADEPGVYAGMKQPDGSVSTASLKPLSNVDGPVPPLDYRSVLDGGDYSMAPPASMGPINVNVNINPVSKTGSYLTKDGKDLAHGLIAQEQAMSKPKKKPKKKVPRRHSQPSPKDPFGRD